MDESMQRQRCHSSRSPIHAAIRHRSIEITSSSSSSSSGAPGNRDTGSGDLHKERVLTDEREDL